MSGMVQGVGFRYFTQEQAERLGVCGYVRNLLDGRVEVYAIGEGQQLARMRAAIERGPHGAMVDGVVEEIAGADQRHDNGFSITYDD